MGDTGRRLEIIHSRSSAAEPFQRHRSRSCTLAERGGEADNLQKKEGDPMMGPIVLTRVADALWDAIIDTADNGPDSRGHDV
jgi:hypothetical protein